MASLPKQRDTVVKHRGIDYLASQQTKFNAAFEAALQELACTALRYRNGDPNDKLYGCIDEEGTE